MRMVNKFTFEYETDVTCGALLKDWYSKVSNLNRRYLFGDLVSFLTVDSSIDKVAILFGLRRTGKTVLTAHVVQYLCESGFCDVVARIYLTSNNDVSQLCRDMRRLRDAGFKYVFIDEATAVEDLYESVAILADIYASSGMRIVLTGTHSLLFDFLRKDKLYDRTVLFDTTFISYKEYVHLHNTASVDDYLRRSGVAVGPALSPFGTIEGTIDYSYTAIANNIKQSLLNYRDMMTVSPLYDLYANDLLTTLIYRVLQQDEKIFSLNAVRKKFKSTDIGNTLETLSKPRRVWISKSGLTVADIIDKASATYEQLLYLSILDPVGSIPVTQTHVDLLRDYLLDLGVCIQVPYYKNGFTGDLVISNLLSQPGLRYNVALAAAHSVLQTAELSSLTNKEKEFMFGRMESELFGNLLEEAVLIELINSVSASNGKWFELIPSVFKASNILSIGEGEIDAIVYDRSSNRCVCIEVKHTSTIQAENQCRWLYNRQVMFEVESNVAPVSKRYVVYLGESKTDVYDGIDYVNVSEFLSDIRKFVCCHE